MADGQMFHFDIRSPSILYVRRQMLGVHSAERFMLCARLSSFNYYWAKRVPFGTSKVRTANLLSGRGPVPFGEYIEFRFMQHELKVRKIGVMESGSLVSLVCLTPNNLNKPQLFRSVIVCKFRAELKFVLLTSCLKLTIRLVEVFVVRFNFANFNYSSK